MHYNGQASLWDAVTIEEDNDPLYVRTIYAEGDIAESGKCGDNAAYTLSRDGTLAVSGTGAIGASAFRDRTDITSVSIPAGITGIGANAFSGCTSITTVAYASDQASWDSVSVAAGNAPITDARVTFAEGDILYREPCGPRAYYTMSNTNDVVITGSGAITDGFFAGNTDIKTVDIRANVSSVGANAFFGCTALESVTMSNRVASVGENAFSGCTAVETLHINGSKDAWDQASVSDGNAAIQNARTTYSAGSIRESGVCGEGTTYTIGTNETLTVTGTTVDAEAFKDYGELRSVVLPASVTSIGADAFSGCTFGSVTYQDSVDKWNALWTDGSFAAQGNDALKTATLYAADGDGEFEWEESEGGRIVINGTGELGLMDWGDLTGKVVMLDVRTTDMTSQARSSLQNASAILLLPAGDYDGYADEVAAIRALGFENVRLLGDSSGSGNIFASDISAALRYPDGNPDSLDELSALALDVDADGDVDFTDCLLMARYLVGSITSFPVSA